MRIQPRLTRLGIVLALTGAAACGSAGGVRGMVASVTRPPRDRVEGTVTFVDPSARRISVRSRRGQTVALAYDTNTRVVYRDHMYVVTALAPGDEVTAHLRPFRADSLYTDSVQVTLPVPATAGDSTSTLAPSVDRP